MDSWIETQKRLLNATTIEPEPMNYVHIHLCYVDANDEISEFKTVKHMSSDISEPDMYKMVQEYKKPSYVFVEMSSFIAQKFDDSEFKTYPMVSALEFPPALFIYHDINSLLFLYKEKCTSGTKASGTKASGTKVTKRVRFALKDTLVSPMKGTRKR